MENKMEKTPANNYDYNVTFSIRKRKILFAFQLRITLKALTEINLASGHTKEDKNKENLIILTKKSFVEAFILTIV